MAAETFAEKAAKESLKIDKDKLKKRIVKLMGSYVTLDDVDLSNKELLRMIAERILDDLQ